MRTTATTAAVMSALTAFSSTGQSSTARYELVVQSDWTQAVHAPGYIYSAHFSPIIGMIHGPNASMWEPGTIASAAIERMAEMGNPDQLRAIAEAFVVEGVARQRINGPGLMAIHTVTYPSLTFTSNFPLFTMVTMVAPSPDWFMGTHGLSLRDENGVWIPELVVQLEVYDAGTDSAIEFMSENDDTQPQEPIRNIQNEHPFYGVPHLGTFTFRLLSVDVCLADVNGDESLTPADFSAWIDAFNASAPAADQNADGLILPNDFAAWVQNFNAGC